MKIRELVGFQLKNPVITDAQRIAIGLHIHDTTPTNIPVPTTRPEIDIDVLDFRRLKIIFHDMDSSGKAKPYGINGAVIAYAVLPEPPANPNALTHTVLAQGTGASSCVVLPSTPSGAIPVYQKEPSKKRCRKSGAKPDHSGYQSILIP